MSLPFSESSRPRNPFSGLAQTALSGSLGFVFMLTALSDAVAQAYRGPDGSDQLQKLLQELETAPKGSPGNILKGLDEKTTPYKVGDMWHYGPYKIKPEVFDLIQAISERNNFPLKIFLDIIARESSFRPNVKSDTGACGLVQFIPSTLRETVFKYAKYLPALTKHDLEGRVLKNKKTVKTETGAERLVVSFDPATAEDAKLLEKLCSDPEFNLELGMQYKLEVAAILQKFLDEVAPKDTGYYPLKAPELYLGFFAGHRVASKMIRDQARGEDFSVLSYDLSPAMLSSETNQAVLYEIDPLTGTKKARTVGQILKKIAEGMGYDSVQAAPALPDIRGHVYKEHRKTLLKAPQSIEDLLTMNPAPGK